MAQVEQRGVSRLYRILFINYSEVQKAFDTPYRQHNEALKYLRDTHEDQDKPFNSGPVTCGVPYTAVAEVVHEDKGPHYRFNEGNMREWSWLEMVAQMTDDSIRTLLGSDVRGHSRGLTHCSVEVRPNSYDHKRHDLIKKSGCVDVSGRLPVWDFVITRTDNTKIRLHPAWKKTEIEVFEPAEGPPHLVPAPMNGIGESDGPGTFKSFQRLQTTGMLRFDPEKQPHQEGRSRGRS